MSTDTTPETETPIQPEADAANQTAAGADQGTEQALLDQVRGDMERFKELALRSTADLENYRKRASREKEDAVKFANAGFLERLIPILDNFELGLSAAKNDSGAAAILAGLEMVARQLQDFLLASGVEPV